MQSALAVLLTALFEPGDAIATDTYTYPNFIGLARQLHLRLVAIEGDDDGMLPDALENACASQNIKGLYLMPAGANPTNIAMSEARKDELALLASRRGIVVLEDDNQAAMLPCRATPLAQRYREGSVYLGGLSKSVCAGLRIAYIYVAPRFVDQVTRSAYNHNLKIPSLNIEIATRLIDSGEADRLARDRLALARRRNKAYHRAFPSLPFDENSLTQWLPLPPISDRPPERAHSRRARSGCVRRGSLCRRRACPGQSPPHSHLLPHDRRRACRRSKDIAQRFAHPGRCAAPHRVNIARNGAISLHRRRSRR